MKTIFTFSSSNDLCFLIQIEAAALKNKNKTSRRSAAHKHTKNCLTRKRRDKCFSKLTGHYLCARQWPKETPSMLHIHQVLLIRDPFLLQMAGSQWKCKLKHIYKSLRGSTVIWSYQQLSKTGEILHMGQNSWCKLIPNMRRLRLLYYQNFVLLFPYKPILTMGSTVAMMTNSQQFKTDLLIRILIRVN